MSDANPSSTTHFDGSALAQALTCLESSRREIRELRSRRTDLIKALRNAAERVASGHLPDDQASILAEWPIAVEPNAEERLNFIEQALGKLRTIRNHCQLAGTTASQALVAQIDQSASALTFNNPGSSELAGKVLGEDGPFSSLLHLASRHSELSDSEWDTAIHAIREEFGAEVAIAAMRGRLFNGNSTAPTISSPDPTTRPSELSASGQASPPANPSDLSVAGGEQSVSPDRSPANALVHDATAAIHSNLADDDLCETSEPTPDGPVLDESWLEALRSELRGQEASGIETATTAWTFLKRGENSLAYHMATDESSLSPKVAGIWAVSRRLVHPHGSLATALKNLVNQLKLATLSREEALLLRAALIRPALLAPETRVSSVLRTLPRSPSHSQFDNLSLRAATAGDRLGGLLGRDFKSASKDELRAELTAWQERVGQRISYDVERPLYLKTHWSLRTPEHHGKSQAIDRWRSQRTLEHLVSRVVRPLLSKGTPAWRSVRVEAERIEQLLELGEVADAERSLVAEGGALAQQYGNSSTDSGLSGFVPAEVSELAAELNVRRDAIREELAEFAKSQETEAASVVAELVDVALNDLGELLAPTKPLWPHEPDLIHVLHGDLLKIPSVVTGPDWRPVDTPVNVAARLAKYSKNPSITLEQAYLAHARVRSYDSCSRIMEVADWPPSQRKKMEKLREDIANSAESTLLDDIADTRDLVDEAVRLHLLDEESAAAIRRRYEHVRYEADSRDEIESFIEFANKLRTQVELRRRSYVRRLKERGAALPQPADPVVEPTPEPPGSHDVLGPGSSVFDD